MFNNQSIFTQLHPARSTRFVQIPNGQMQLYSKTAIGVISGAYRTIPALMAEGVAEGDLWYTINFENERGGYVETVAVLGATSEEQAKAWAHKQFAAQLGVYGYASVNTSDEIALKRYLDRPSADVEKVRIYQRDLDTIRRQVTGKPVIWDENQECVSHGSRSNVLYDMALHDTDEELIHPMTRDGLAEYAATDSEQPEYDALIVQKSHLERMMNRLTAAMSKAAIKDITVTQLTETKPFKRHGVVNVACLFELSDGQSITIVFHNPDSTPSRLDPDDIMTSWKFMLNKRDISAAVSPKQGENVNLNQLAIRMMKLAGQNSAAFKRNQLRQQKNLKFLSDADQRIADKKSKLAQTLEDCEQLQQQIDEASKSNDLDNPKAVIYTREQLFTPAIYAIVSDSEELKQQYQDIYDSFFQGRMVDLRNALRQLGWTEQGLAADLSKNGVTAVFKFEQVGAGANVVGYSVNDLRDDLTQSVEEFAADLDDTAKPVNTADMDFLESIKAGTASGLSDENFNRVLTITLDAKTEGDEETEGLAIEAIMVMVNEIKALASSKGLSTELLDKATEDEDPETMLDEIEALQAALNFEPVVNPLYQSVIDGSAEITPELIRQLKTEAAKDLTHPQLRPATKIVVEKVKTRAQTQEAA